MGLNANKLRNIMIALIVVAVALAAALTIVSVKDSNLVKDLNIEKEQLTGRILDLQKEYADLSSDYEYINLQLDSSREAVSQLVDHIKKTDATNRSKMQQYERELGTLRTIMRSYVYQIDSLNTANKQLTAEVARARKAEGESRRQNEQLSAQVADLASQVAAGAMLKATGISLEAWNASERTTDRSSRVTYMTVNLKIVANDLAAKGFTRLYLRLIDPQDGLVLDESSTVFVNQADTLMASASREVDYEGEELDAVIFVQPGEPFTKGIYTAEVYSEQSRLGAAQVELR